MKQTIIHKTQSFETLSFNDRNFLLDGQDHFLLSGELHYFRIEAGLWKTHLSRMKKAGLNTVSTYIPWSLHEQTEGRPDFRGSYAPNLNLAKFIELCAEMDLHLTVKPGPYILAELILHGLPKWFFEKYPQAAACDPAGRPYPVKYACLSHPDYLKKAGQWIDAVLSFLSPYQTTRSGPLSFMQVCNEVGIFQWLGGGGDYSRQSVNDYRAYLAEQYKTIDELNNCYGSNYKDFHGVFPPAGKVTSRSDCLAYTDWHTFHRQFYVRYLQHLISAIRSAGIQIPIFHNVPGWVFGRAKEMPVCLSMYMQIARLYPDLLLGVDHIPENVSWRNFHDDRLINAFTKAIQGGRGPVYVAELQAGTREENVMVYPAEMELFYKACLANGVVGMNYYMFSQGRNPPGWSIYDDMFYHQTPLDAEGNPGPLYPVIQILGKMIQTHGRRLTQCQTSARQAIAFYPPYYYREFTRPLFTGENFDDITKTGGRLDPKMVTDDLLFEGLARLLVMDNQEVDMLDSTRQDQSWFPRYRQIWLACTEQMDYQTQRRMLDYVQAGGHLICFPTLPRMDLKARPCSVLADGLGIQSDRLSEVSEERIYWEDTGQEIHTIPYMESFKAEKARVIARTADRKVCGLEVKIGKGSAVILGTGFKHQAPAHRFAWQKLGLDEEFQSPIRCDNPLVITRFRKHQTQGGYLFLLNYHNQQIQTHISFTEDGRTCDLGLIVLEATSGLMLPFNLPLTEQCTLTAVSSEVREIRIDKNRIQLKLYGNRKTRGRAIFSVEPEVQEVFFNNRPLRYSRTNNSLQFDYSHSGRPADTIKIIT